MMTDRELMQQALLALEANQPVNYCMNNNGEKFPMMQGDPFRFDRNTKAITALRERLAQPEQCQYPDCNCATENPCLKGLVQPQRTHWEGCEEVHPECKAMEKNNV